MEKVARLWTEQEQQQLLDDYFRLAPGLCPVCDHEVSMILSCLAERVTLLLKCEGCGNKATASRGLKHLSPLVARSQDIVPETVTAGCDVAIGDGSGTSSS
jgi:hypothetical protein